MIPTCDCNRMQTRHSVQMETTVAQLGRKYLTSSTWRLNKTTTAADLMCGLVGHFMLKKLNSFPTNQIYCEFCYSLGFLICSLVWKHDFQRETTFSSFPADQLKLPPSWQSTLRGKSSSSKLLASCCLVFLVWLWAVPSSSSPAHSHQSDSCSCSLHWLTH